MLLQIKTKNNKNAQETIIAKYKAYGIKLRDKIETTNIKISLERGKFLTGFSHQSQPIRAPPNRRLRLNVRLGLDRRV